MTLTLSGVGKRYGEVTALEGIDLTVAAGTRTAIVGPSGSGKSTLLRLVAGFDAPDTGKITLDSDVLARPAAVMPTHRRGIGIVSQDGALFPHLSVAENIAFGLSRRDPDRAARVRDLMAMVELDGRLAKRPPDALSGGQQQRVALARALARHPRLMLLDEPFSALDTDLRANTRRAVAAVLASAGVTTLLVTHDRAEALSFADQVAVLLHGRLVQAGPPREVYRYPRNRDVARLLGDAILLPARVADGWGECALGRLAVAATDGSGARELMVRPEQVVARPDPGRGDVAGRVEDVEYQGAACLLKCSVGALRFGLRVPAPDAPLVGATIGLRVEGKVHAFVEEDEGDAGAGSPEPRTTEGAIRRL